MPRRVRSRSRSGTRIFGRGRSRSRDRTNCCHRHRGHRDSISRSASRGLYDQPEEPVQAIKKLVTSQQEIILDMLSEHRAEVDEKIQLKSRRFSSKQIEKQYQINTEFRELVAKITAALHASEVGRARTSCCSCPPSSRTTSTTSLSPTHRPTVGWRWRN